MDFSLAKIKRTDTRMWADPCESAIPPLEVELLYLLL